MIPRPAIIIGRAIRFMDGTPGNWLAIPAVAPISIVAITAPTYDSYRSAPIPAISPTLSPTLSAITAGFRGSSSGIPASTLPTRSAPTSAALVKIPPPTRAKSAIEDAPRENPDRMLMVSWSVTPVIEVIRKNIRDRPIRPRPTTVRPMTIPAENETLKADAIPCFAAFAVLTFAFVAENMPINPARAEREAPTT